MLPPLTVDLSPAEGTVLDLPNAVPPTLTCCSLHHPDLTAVVCALSGPFEKPKLANRIPGALRVGWAVSLPLAGRI